MKRVRRRCAQVLRVSLRTIAGTALLAAATACLVSCATLAGLNSWADSHSFASVAFGDSQGEVEELYPQAQPGTTPYGAQMLLVSNLESNGLHFQRVIFAFSSAHGMQLVAARFDPSMTEPIYQKLCKAFGRQPHHVPGRPIRAHWLIADGASVGIDGARGRLFFVGPHGGSLSRELALIAQNSNL